MKRLFLLAAILALLTTRLSAREVLSEPSIWITDDENDEPVPMSSHDDGTKDAAGSLRLSLEADVTSQESSIVEELPPGDTFETLPPGDAVETMPLGDIYADEVVARGFHSVCDCCCHIPSIGCWCDCCPPCCTTDCWVEYPCQCSQGNCYLTEDGNWVSNDAFCDVSGTDIYGYSSAVRFGWWAVDFEGSPTKVGEYQDLSPSPFWDIDAISSDGVRTWDITLTGLDNESSDARVRYYGPAVSAKFDYERYPHRLDHNPLVGFNLLGPIPPGPDDNVVVEDLNVGQDYAIRVQQLNAKFKGHLTDNLKWRLNLWGQRKFGHRQANAAAHCFFVDDDAGNTCHVLSQSQTIDWLTMEVQPVVEAELKNITIEYSRTMRSFTQDDAAVTRQYTHFSGFTPANDTLGPPYDYSLVPDNFTQIDRLKIGGLLTDYNRLYANLFIGNTKNKFRDTHRRFNGFDVRLMNDSFEDLDTTFYVSRYAEDNEFPPFFLTSPPLAPDNTYDEDSLRHAVDYTRTRAGVKWKWDPNCDRRSCYPSYGFWNGTSWAAGYEYYQLEREFVTYDIEPTPFTQPNTVTNGFHIGPTTRWTPNLQTYTRYKARFIHIPLIGVSEYSEDDPDTQGAFNTSLPEQVHAVELGGTWTPTDNFMTSLQFTIENSWNDSQYANFTENDYPIVLTVWYAPTCRLAFTGGYAFYSNWIDQDITLGTNRGDPTETSTREWNYAGKNHQFSFNTSYAWTECLQLVAGYEWNRGNNSFTLPPFQEGADWSLLPSLSDVIVETNRVTAGVDWQPNGYMDVYFRYILFDYDDISAGRDSGTSHMALAGAGVNW